MSAKNIPIAIFQLGRIVATSNALSELSHSDIQGGIARHSSGDWGDLDEEDRSANDQALSHGGRLFSVYHGVRGTKFYIITEADRSVTTVLLPEDY
jgi:hypothetical protein